MEICPTPGRLPSAPLQLTRNFMSGLVARRVTKQPLRYYAAATNSNFSTRTQEVKSGSQNRMFILGMGFVGQFFALDLKNKGWAVSGTCTSVSKKNELEEMGFNVHVFDANEPEIDVLDTLNYHTHLLISIPPRVGIGDPVLQYGELLGRKLDNKNLQWLGYLSSTSVYGDRGGDWVDESYQPLPANELAKSRLAAEEGWLSLGHDLGLPPHIFRLGGIYGPGRSAIDTITKQGPLSEVQRIRSLRKYTSRIHVADICNALNASLHRPSPGRIYNIVDDEPASRAEVFSYAWDLIPEKWPDQVKQMAPLNTTESLMITKRSPGGEKRVSNARMKKELGVTLLHPDYRSGLRSIMNQMHSPP